MNESKKLQLQLLSIGAIFAVPYIGAYIYYGGNFPDNYFAFPHLDAVEKACFSYPVLIAACFAALGVFVFLFFPTVFGFKKVSLPNDSPVSKVALPKWFWVGLLMWGSAMTCFVFQLERPKLLVNWADLPLFWGLTLMLDGWVYVRRGGHSIIGDYPKAIIGIGVSAVLGWLLFEYLNNFVLESWYYPKGDIIPDDEFVIYAVLGSSGLIPPAIEFYALIRTFKGLSVKYTNGPKITFPNWALYLALAISLLSLFLAPYFPDILFPALWYSPMILIAVVLTWCKVWTPFTPVQNGDYSYVVLLSLSYFFLGLCLECFNYLSATHIVGQPNACGDVFKEIGVTYNASYWVYSIPYLNRYHLFEMPIFGYLGYFPFGVYCAVWWILFSNILGIKTDFKNNGC
jgi:hypothetical protein